jgi:hypothetical protein
LLAMHGPGLLKGCSWSWIRGEFVPPHGKRNPNGGFPKVRQRPRLRVACRGAQACGLVSASGFSPDAVARAWLLYKLRGIRDSPNRAMSHCVPGDALRVA